MDNASHNSKHMALLGAIVLVLIVGLFQTHSLKVDLDLSEHSNSTITVTGKAERQVAPDTAKISFYVTKKGMEQAQTTNYVNNKTKDVIDMLVAEGIEKKDIKTTNYSLTPEYNWNDGNRQFTGYRVSQNVTVKVRDLTAVPNVLAKIVAQNVDSLSGPDMYIDKLDDIKDELRSEAIDDAKAKAKELADELGVEVSKIVGFSENSNDDIGVYNVDVMRMETKSAMGGGVSAPEITPGEDTIEKRVTITYKIEN